jgi:hypothetical protein
MKPVDKAGVQAVDIGRMTGGPACGQFRPKCGQGEAAPDRPRSIPSRPQRAAHDIHKRRFPGNRRQYWPRAAFQQTWPAYIQQQQQD